MRLLFVCTGNVCRSAVAERLTRAWAEQAAGDGAVQVTSAGLTAAIGEPMHPSSAAALRRLGGDPEGFRARGFRAELAERADLVLTMTREHRTAVLKQTPRGLRRTFTLLEAAGLLERAELEGLGALPLDRRGRELGLRLDAARAFRPGSSADDVADPIHGHGSAHKHAATTIAAALRPLAAVLFGAPALAQGQHEANSASDGALAIPTRA